MEKDKISTQQLAFMIFLLLIGSAWFMCLETLPVRMPG